MPWGGAGGQNIEHPHTPAILSSFSLLQIHFSVIGKAQFRRATLFCDSSYFIYSFTDYNSLQAFQHKTLVYILVIGIASRGHRWEMK